MGMPVGWLNRSISQKPTQMDEVLRNKRTMKKISQILKDSGESHCQLPPVPKKRMQAWKF